MELDVQGTSVGKHCLGLELCAWVLSVHPVPNNSPEDSPVWRGHQTGKDTAKQG